MAKPGTGEAVEAGIRKASDLAKTGIGALGDHLGEGHVLDVVSSVVGAAIDFGGKAAKGAVDGAGKAQELASAGTSSKTEILNKIGI